MTPLACGERLAEPVFRRLRRQMVLNHCKWDPQVEDVGSLCPYPLFLNAEAWKQLSTWAECLATETLRAEEEMLQRPELLKPSRIAPFGTANPRQDNGNSGILPRPNHAVSIFTGQRTDGESLKSTLTFLVASSSLPRSRSWSGRPLQVREPPGIRLGPMFRLLLIPVPKRWLLCMLPLTATIGR